MTSNKKIQFGLKKSISISVFLHISIIGILLYGSFFADKATSIDGDNAIKAVMIDLSVLAAPEQSLIEDAPHIDGAEEPLIVDSKIIELDPVDAIDETEPDIVVEKEKVDKIELPSKPTELVIKEKTVKPNEIKKKQPPVQKSSLQQKKQEIATDKIADTAVAPAISSNIQFSVTPTPISRSYPEYPRRALDMRIEGHVVVLYDINKDGRVENIRIVESKPSNIFNRTVINAMKHWKYQTIIAKDLTIKIIFNRNKSIQLENS